MDQKRCPFCRALAQNGCAHLAVACDGRDFVNRCVELCHGQTRWQTICDVHAREVDRPTGSSPARLLDFTWIETAFCEKFLKHLRWFGGLDLEWRTTPNPKQAGSWALLWSRDPQRLWWELFDDLDRQAEELTGETGMIYCPICKQPFSNEQPHEHLAISADESEVVRRAVEFADAEALWDCLCRESSEDYVRDASSFLSAFVEPCPAAARVDSEVWTGGAPGLSAVWTCLWTADPARLREEIRDRLLEEVARVRLAKAKVGQSKEPATELPRELIEQFVEATKQQGGALLVNGQVLEGAMDPDEADLESYPGGSPSPGEMLKRRRLLRLARRALKLCKDEHPLCLQALDILKAFNSGQKGYRDLAIARSRLSGRVSAAGVVGLPHRCSNAAATLACFHACNINLCEAIRQTEYFFEMTKEFVGTRVIH
jgi:hypothetical protein